MIDDSDVDFAILASPSGGLLVSLVSLVFVIALVVLAVRDRNECERRHCERGSPIVTNHECICVERAVP